MCTRAAIRQHRTKSWRFARRRGDHGSRCHLPHRADGSGRPPLLAILEAGCYVAYDLFGMVTTGTYYASHGITLPSDSQRLDQIRTLFDEGHGDRILMSHDICFKHRLARYDGGGYGHLLTNVLPRMAGRGFSPTDVDALLVENSRRVLA